jgi:hypothetical protein
MTTPTAIEVNCATGEVTERPLTAEEITQLEADAAVFAAARAEEDAVAETLAALKESAKAKLVAGEPLTEDEASVLVI